MSSAQHGHVKRLECVKPPRTQETAFVDASEDPIIGLTPDGYITSWNPAAVRLYGYSAEEAVGRSIVILVPPELCDGRESLLGAVRAGRAVRQHETQRLAKDGRRIEVSISISPITDQSGAVVGAVAFTRDSTAYKERERQLRESEARLAEAQRLAQLGSWEWDVRTNTVTWSDELYRINGRVHLTPTYEGYLETVHPDDLEIVTRTIERSFAEGMIGYFPAKRRYSISTCRMSRLYITCEIRGRGRPRSSQRRTISRICQEAKLETPRWRTRPLAICSATASIVSSIGVAGSGAWR